ncbi:unnamed protein product [Symbiodinium sp. CCMP2592]|nr:unnamed protein product [Symbiodinium sp. CCMP2592]
MCRFSITGADGSVLEEGHALMCAACVDDAEADRLWAPEGELMQCCQDIGYVCEWLQISFRPLWPRPQVEELPKGLAEGKALCPVLPIWWTQALSQGPRGTLCVSSGSVAHDCGKTVQKVQGQPELEVCCRCELRR